MKALSIGLIALAMSTDAFAAALGKGTALQRPNWWEAVRTGLIFGVIEALTPLMGWALGLAASNFVKAWDHWIAFALLAGLGTHMIWAGWRGSHDDEPVGKPTQHSFWLLAVTGFATSIDAMAVGIGLAFVDVPILVVSAAIGAATFTMVTAGVMLGTVLGTVAGRWAEGLGGVLLIGVGSSILVEHLKAGL